MRVRKCCLLRTQFCGGIDYPKYDALIVHIAWCRMTFKFIKYRFNEITKRILIHMLCCYFYPPTGILLTPIYMGIQIWRSWLYSHYYVHFWIDDCVVGQDTDLKCPVPPYIFGFYLGKIKSCFANI